MLGFYPLWVDAIESFVTAQTLHADCRTNGPEPCILISKLLLPGDSSGSLHPTTYTLHPTPNTLHPTPYTYRSKWFKSKMWLARHVQTAKPEFEALAAGNGESPSLGLSPFGGRPV